MDQWKSVGLRLAVAFAVLAGWSSSVLSVATTYPTIDYRPRYHITCERGQLDYPTLVYTRDSSSLVYHIFYHCSSLPTNETDDLGVFDYWYHTTSNDLMRWQTSELHGFPAKTRSISILQPLPNITRLTMVFSNDEGIYLAHSLDTTLIQWNSISKQPIIKPPEGVDRLDDPYIFSNGTTMYYILAGAGLNSTTKQGMNADKIAPVVYLYESTNLLNWTNTGTFWQGTTDMGSAARSIDFYEVDNGQSAFTQQVLTITLPEQAGSFCISGSVNFTSSAYKGFKVVSFRHQDYGTLLHSSSILDTLGRRLSIGMVEEMRSKAWQTHDQYAGTVSIPRMVLALPAAEVGFKIPEDVSYLYGKPLGRLTGISLDSNETATMPLYTGNQLTLLATLSITPTGGNFSTGFRVLASPNLEEYTTISVTNNPSTAPLTCLDITPSYGFDREGGDYHTFEIPTYSQCKAECCSDPMCKSWVFVNKMKVSQGFNCTVGTNCCFLKNTQPPLTPSLLNITSGIAETQNSVLSVSTLKSSLSKEAHMEEKHVPFQYAPPDLFPKRPQQALAENKEGTDHPLGDNLPRSNGPVTEAVTLQIFLDHSILEVFVENALVITERVYPTLVDSIGVQLFSINAHVTFDSIEGYDMEGSIN